jgi:hypothetical protein
MDSQLAVTQVTRALALAHAALDDDASRVIEARGHALAVLLRAKGARPATLADAHDLLTLVDQLRGLVGLLESKLLKPPTQGELHSSSGWNATPSGSPRLV